MFFPDNQEILYTHFTKMSLSDQVHDISVRAMNKLFLKSTDVETNITVTTSAPVVDGRCFYVHLSLQISLFHSLRCLHAFKCTI